jgi:tetratricopeptide (TPR) repeat protein
MRKEWFFAAAVALATLVAALGAVQWLAPQLLGVPADLQLVQVSREVPPFFDGVFRDEDYESDEFLVADTYIIRARPLLSDQGGLGPHDILGFRNREIPHSASIITIGDSQTYGNNAVIDETWPGRVASILANRRLYSMAVGGWGAVEYLEIFDKALRFSPRLVVVAFYTGNDPLESFRRAYARERWASLRPAPSLQLSQMPPVTYPPPESEFWFPTFSDRLATGFTPTYRLASNQDHPVVRAGYEIMAEVARRIGERADAAGARVAFTIIPTKELVFARKVEQDNLTPPADYTSLVAGERANLERLAGEVAAVPGAIYVDVVAPLQEAALLATPLYRADTDGHPVAAGYAVIGETIAERVRDLMETRGDDEVESERFVAFESGAALNLSLQFYNQGRFSDSIDASRRALTLNPDYAEAYNNIAAAYAALGQWDDAIQAANQAIRLKPDFQLAKNNLAWATRERADGGVSQQAK